LTRHFARKTYNSKSGKRMMDKKAQENVFSEIVSWAGPLIFCPDRTSLSELRDVYVLGIDYLWILPMDFIFNGST
jgi:hypothetical protein